MPVIATEPKRLSDLVKEELWASSGYCRKVVTVDSGSAFTLSFGECLGKISATGVYIPAVDTAVDGSATIAAIYIGTVDGTFGVDAEISADGTDVIALVQGPAIVGADALVYDSSFTAAEVEADLAALNIVVGDQL